MAVEQDPILSRLPPDKQVTPAVCEAMDKLIRDGVEMNALQRDIVISIVKILVEQNQPPLAMYESFCACAYLDWTDEAKTSEDAKKQLAGLVRFLKSSGPVANSVARLAQDIVQKRAARREALKRLAEAMVASAANPDKAKRDSAREPAKGYVRKMQEARLGTGGQPMANLNLAVQLAEEATDAYPNTPLVLFEAAGCYQMLAEKSPNLSPTERYVHLRQAHTLYQRCYDCLTAHPYSNLKTPEFDKWRAGTASLLVKIHKDLEKLQEMQEKMK